MSTLISTIITAGGNSVRFGSNKLLEKIGNKTVLETTIEKFLPFCDEIIVPCHQEIEKILPKNPKIKTVPFGETRQKSIYNALCACNNPKYVLIHDGARPFIDSETIEKTIEKVKEKNAVVVGVYAIDTIKIVDIEGKILKTIDRNTVFQAQTPQAFLYKDILDAHVKLKNENFTDDAGMFEKLNIPIYTIAGSIRNKKITVKEDLF